MSHNIIVTNSHNVLENTLPWHYMLWKGVLYLETTCVLHPNTIHKLSHLYLALVAYKDEDPKLFQCNLCVSPETFDALDAKIEGHPIFQNVSPNEQLQVDQQLAIVLFHFCHFGNSASVESVAQWAGCSAGMVVNATWWIIEVFLAYHDDVIHYYLSAADKEAAKEWVEAASCTACISKSVCCLKMLARTWDAYLSISRSLKQKVRDQKWFFFVLFNTLKKWNLLVQPKSTTFFYFYYSFYTFWDKLES